MRCRDGTPTALKPDTPALFEYGILTENSDIRAHVSGANQTIYVFQTKRGVQAIETYQPPIVYGYQPGVEGPTSSGWLVQPDWIEDLRRVRFASWSGWADLAKPLSTSDKGALAVQCVTQAMRLGRFPVWFDAIEDTRDYVQLAGTDMLVFVKKRVQVKCDYTCGDKPLGSGNLYLQKAERTPLNRI